LPVRGAELKTLVRAFIVGTFVTWIGFDVWLSQNSGPTESMVLAEWGRVSMFFPFLIGFLCGHWFAPLKKPWPSGWMLGIPIFLALIVWDVITYNTVGVTDVWYRYPGLWCAIGIPAGSLLWGQRR